MFNTAGLVARVDRVKALRYGKNLLAHLQAKGLSVFLEPTLAKYVNRLDVAVPLEKMKVDLLITIGGDGTILMACLQIPKPEPPILAINMGVRGFLTEVAPRDGLEAVDKCLRGEFVLERCMKIASLMGGARLPDALNEVFITADAPVKLLHARIWRDSMSVAECQADGVMVASQVGSTGYSLSAGGPVLDPDVNAFVLTPVVPLIGFRPMVFPTTSTISIEVFRPKKAVVVLDGHYRREIDPKTRRVTITKSEYESCFIRFKGDFYRRLKGRLLFSKGRRI
ncbi:MAG: putative inorganic polyphosphate/ATP-NAD kinase [Candidatus Bathyarchaeota archaeon BA1]|nr:MAG: putative inorganic polyphosphate/ATP-NAD kinase [Candidatus Bathyarchaeota archaeon BA1]